MEPNLITEKGTKQMQIGAAWSTMYEKCSTGNIYGHLHTNCTNESKFLRNTQCCSYNN